jgi:hypothetical protein
VPHPSRAFCERVGILTRASPTALRNSLYPCESLKSVAQNFPVVLRCCPYLAGTARLAVRSATDNEVALPALPSQGAPTEALRAHNLGVRRASRCRSMTEAAPTHHKIHRR